MPPYPARGSASAISRMAASRCGTALALGDSVNTPEACALPGRTARQPACHDARGGARAAPALASPTGRVPVRPAMTDP